MPAVSVNLSDEAYSMYKRHREHRDGSRFVSAAIMFYGTKDEFLPLLKDGDERISVTGQTLRWKDGEGWEVVG